MRPFGGKMSSKVNKGVEIDLGLRASASWVLAMGTVITMVYVDYIMQRFKYGLANH